MESIIEKRAYKKRLTRNKRRGSSVKRKKEFANIIIETTANFYNIPLIDVKSKCRKGKITKVCQISSYLIVRLVDELQFDIIASLYGIRYRNKDKFDHSAIIYNRKVIMGFRKNDDVIRNEIDKIIEQVNEVVAEKSRLHLERSSA